MARGDVHIAGHWGGSLCGESGLPTTRRQCQECVWEEERQNASRRGLTPTPPMRPNQLVVISMTTIPERIAYIQPTIDSILSQSRKPDEVRVYTGFDCDPIEGVRTIRVEDLGPITKLSAAFDPELPPETLVVTADDDILYGPDWLATLVSAASEHPDEVVGMSGWDARRLIADGRFFTSRPGICDVIEGWGGVAYRKRFFVGCDLRKIVTNKYTNDDVWISAYLRRIKVPRRVVGGPLPHDRNVTPGVHNRATFVEDVRREAKTCFTDPPTAASTDRTGIVVCHSPLEKCGIAEYGQQLDAALRALDAHVEPTTTRDLTAVADAGRGSVILYHFEPGIVCATDPLVNARRKGAKVVFCCHYFDANVAAHFGDVADAFVVHRSYGVGDPKVREIPLGCPMYEPRASRAMLRERYDIPKDAMVVTTIGLLAAWKQTPSLVTALLAVFSRIDGVFLQILTPLPNDAARSDADTIAQLVRGRDDVFFSTEFRSERDLLDRVHASDVGVLYHAQDTGSVSAATKLFVSTRTPLVVTTTSHSSDIQGGAVRVTGFNVKELASACLNLVTNAPRLAALRQEMTTEYRRLNIVDVARRYLDLFDELLDVMEPTAAPAEKVRAVVVHSPHEKCGIAEYGRQLDESMRRAGANVIALTHKDPDAIVDAVADGTPILIHFEWSLVGSEFETMLRRIRARGARVILCCHWFGPAVVERYGSVVDHIVVHRDYGERHPKVVEIPLGCPTYEPPTQPRSDLRRELKLPEEATIATTVGFLSEWKQFPQVIGSILRRWPSNTDLFLQVLAPIPFAGDRTNEVGKMHSALATANEHANRVLFSTDFLTEKEVLDRIFVSDLGFVYHARDTGSVSAATKQYVSARCPLVTTGSSHASDLQGGVVRSTGVIGRDFVLAVLGLAEQSAVEKRDRLRREMDAEYRRLNMDAVATMYFQLFNQLR